MATKTIISQTDNDRIEITVSDDAGTVTWQSVVYDCGNDDMVKHLSNDTGYVCDYLKFGGLIIAIDNYGVVEIVDADTLETMCEGKYTRKDKPTEIIVGKSLDEAVNNFTLEFDLIGKQYIIRD